MTRRLAVSAAALLTVLVAAPVHKARAQQTRAGARIATARGNMDDLQWTLVAQQLRDALDSASQATPQQRVRALVLLTVTHLNLAQQDSSYRDSAQVAARGALTLSPRERVDTLADYYQDIVAFFDRLRPPLPATLEVRGLPEEAQLRVDGVVWARRKQELQPGRVLLEVSSRGYQVHQESVTVRPAEEFITTVTLVPAQPGRLSVSSVPWGLVYLDSGRVGETPIYDRAFPSGAYRVSIRTPSGAVVHQQTVDLQPGRPTNLGTLGPPRSQGDLPAPFAHADSLFRALAFDSALAAYRSLATDSTTVPSASHRAWAATRAGIIHFAAARGRGPRAAYEDSARAAFRAALRLAPAVRADPVEAGAELVAFEDSSRNTALFVRLTVPGDTLVAVTDPRLPFVVSASHAARLTATVSRTDQPGAVPLMQRTARVAPSDSALTWNLRGTDGQVVPDGRYLLRVVATDAAGRTSEPEQRLLTVENQAPDTTVVPAPLPPSAFAPESQRLARGPASAMLLGAAIGGGTVLLNAVAGNSVLNSGMATDPGVFIAAGTATVAGFVGFLAGYRLRPLPENIAANQRHREDHERQRAAIVEQNARARANVRVRVRAEVTR